MTTSQRVQQKQRVDHHGRFARQFDEWLIKADDAFRKPTTRWEGAATLADFITIGPPRISVDREVVSLQTDAIFELAKLCFRFIVADTAACAQEQLQAGKTISEIKQSSAAYVGALSRQVYARKFLIGLRAIDGGTLPDVPVNRVIDGSSSSWDRPYDSIYGVKDRLEGSALAVEAWAVGVDEVLTEVMPSLVDDILRRNPRKRRAPVQTANRETVSRFKVAVLGATGVRITNPEIAFVAGRYKDDSELKRFMRDDPRLTKAGARNFSEVLKLPPQTFIEKLRHARSQS